MAYSINTMVSGSHKKILNQQSLIYRLGAYGITAVFILFFLLSTHSEFGFNHTRLKNSNYEIAYCPPGPTIMEINCRSNQLTFLEGLKNKRSIFTFLSPFDIAYRSMDSQPNKLNNSLEFYNGTLRINYRLNFLLLDLPPPSI